MPMYRLSLRSYVKTCLRPDASKETERTTRTAEGSRSPTFSETISVCFDLVIVYYGVHCFVHAFSSAEGEGVTVCTKQ